MVGFFHCAILPDHEILVIAFSEKYEDLNNFGIVDWVQSAFVEFPFPKPPLPSRSGEKWYPHPK
jgi:hypothetical protein